MFAAFAVPAQAALGQFDGRVTSMRVEQSMGFIGFSVLQSGSQCPGTRAWVDMQTENGRAMYATALTAFSLQKRVVLRVDDAGTRVYDVCHAYDIYMEN